MVPNFSLSCIFVLGFSHLRPSVWLEVLITYGLLVEVFSVFRQDSVVTGLK
jgi:hypothetical protein